MTAMDMIPPATIARLSRYVRTLDDLVADGRTTVSSQDLADGAGIQPALVRRDLSWFGTLGTRGVGYDVATLRSLLGQHVADDRLWPIVIVGAGNLGSALARQFDRNPFRVVAVVDSNPDIVGTMRGSVVVTPQGRLAVTIAEHGALIGVVAVPVEAAQGVCDDLVAAGIRSILSFAPISLTVPPDVQLRTVDLAQELSILAFHESQRGIDPA